MNSVDISFLHIDSGSANYMNVNFSPAKAEKRIRKANELLGKNVVRWIIGFALFLLGAKRKAVSNLLGIPYETLNSSIRRIQKDKAKAFEDRRTSSATPPTPLTPPTPPTPTERAVCAPTAIAKIQGDEVIIHLPYETVKSQAIRIPAENKVMVKAVLFTLLQNQMLNSQTVSDILGYTQSHTLSLKRQILSGSTEALLDGRQGQKQCHVFKPEVKAELIQQYCANAIVGKSTSSGALVSSLKERCGLDLCARTIRYYVRNLGLKNIVKTLPDIIEQLKKSSAR